MRALQALQKIDRGRAWRVAYNALEKGAPKSAVVAAATSPASGPRISPKPSTALISALMERRRARSFHRSLRLPMPRSALGGWGALG